jgi:hypothetical protein
MPSRLATSTTVISESRSRALAAATSLGQEAAAAASARCRILRTPDIGGFGSIALSPLDLLAPA